MMIADPKNAQGPQLELTNFVSCHATNKMMPKFLTPHARVAIGEVKWTGVPPAMAPRRQSTWVKDLHCMKKETSVFKFTVREAIENYHIDEEKILQVLDKVIDLNEDVKVVKDDMQAKYDQFKWCLQKEEEMEAEAAKSTTDPEVIAEAKERTKQAKQRLAESKRKVLDVAAKADEKKHSNFRFFAGK